jgi:hypothetical protein
MDINEAQAVIQGLADEFTAALRAKGYDKAHAEIWIGREGRNMVTAYTPETPVSVSYYSSLDRLVDEFRNAVADMPHRDAEALAYADEMAQPLFLMSEQPTTQAAE